MEQLRGTELAKARPGVLRFLVIARWWGQGGDGLVVLFPSRTFCFLRIYREVVSFLLCPLVFLFVAHSPFGFGFTDVSLRFGLVLARVLRDGFS